MLQPFLDSLRPGDYHFREDDLRKRIGDPIVNALVGCGVLVPQQANWYPCPDGGRCNLRVMKLGSGLIALPADNQTCCTPLTLTQRDVRGLRLCFSTWLHELRRLFGLTGPCEESRPAFRDTYWIGHQRPNPAEVPRKFMYCAATHLGEILGHLHRFLAQGRSMTVLCPSRDRVLASGELDAVFESSEGVQLIFLSEHLEVSGGRLTLRSASRAPDTKGEPFAEVVTAEGRRVVDEQGFRDLADRRCDYDLVVDTFSASSRHVRCWVRDAAGALTEVPVSPVRAALAIELILAGKPLRPGQFRCLEAGDDGSALFRRMRRQLDRRLPGRREYRVFKTRAGVGGQGTHFAFSPPEGYRYLVMSPLRGLK